MNEIIWWCFYEVHHLMEVSGLNAEDALRMAEWHAFQVVQRHNLAVQQKRIPESAQNKGLYWVDIVDLTDSQCNLLHMLSTDETYKLPYDHTPGSTGFNRIPSRLRERGEAMEGFAAICMLAVIVLIAGYFFVWPFVKAAVDYSEVISGLF